MSIKIKGAKENNLKNIDLEIGNGHTVFTGVSGSGKSSLLFDTIYHEARRRIFTLFRMRDEIAQLPPADVEAISGLKPAIGILQNIKNRNPYSTLATAAGIHVLLRILYANYGVQHCSQCGMPVHIRSEDNIAEGLVKLSKGESIEIHVRILNKVKGSHRSLLQLLFHEFPQYEFVIDGEYIRPESLDPGRPHTITVRLNESRQNISLAQARKVIETAKAFGVGFLVLHRTEHQKVHNLTFRPICPECNTVLEKLKPAMFNKNCPYCNGSGCGDCRGTGMYPAAAGTTWQGMTFQNILTLPLEEFGKLLAKENTLPASGEGLQQELVKKTASLLAIGLGYLSLDRPSPTLSRGEYQRLQIARAMTNDMEDVMYLLDEPTIGLHPSEVGSILPELGKLKGTVLTIEHDRQAILSADQCIELGPEAGANGGIITYIGKPSLLPGITNTTIPYRTPITLQEFIEIKGANARNLKDIDISIPVAGLTVMTGVSGSGKSTLIEEVLLPSLEKRRPVGCSKIIGSMPKAMFVDQDPIGANSRSNPATYTQLFDDIREYFAWKTGVPSSFFAFNTGQGGCPHCKGHGEIEVKMRYLPSTWIKCPVCEGSKYSQEVLKKRICIADGQYSIADFLNLRVQEVWTYIENGSMPLDGFQKENALRTKIQALLDVGLSYIQLGQPSPTLSGGEAQRVKLARILGQSISQGMLLIFDEPTTGLHKKDVKKILLIFDRLKAKGITVLVIEHNTDVMKYADWLIELGLGSGPAGGSLMFMGTPEELAEHHTKTAFALHSGDHALEKNFPRRSDSDYITINNAYANNLKNISLTIPKNEMVVITGVSGSGKSTLVWDVVETEAKRRFLETLTAYERYNIHEAKSSGAEAVTGLGLVCSIAPEKWMYSPRSTIGTITRIYETLARLFARIGSRKCPSCNEIMTNREDGWYCKDCNKVYEYFKPGSFSPDSYSGACTTCQGVGTVSHLNENKLIINPDKPLLRGAMYSPGFFPKGFLGKPGNSGYYYVRAFAQRYGFDPEQTPWKEMSEEARHKFLFGDKVPMTVHFVSPKGVKNTQILPFPGFKGWINDWDLGGTYTDHLCCPACNGSGLKPEYNEITLFGYSIHELCQLSIEEIYLVLHNTPNLIAEIPQLRKVWDILGQKLKFMIQTGLSYVHLGRFSSTLSAGEAQRIKLTTLLDNEMKGLILLLDEPTRGLHSTEVANLMQVLKHIQKSGNTLIIVEHDTSVIREADSMVEIGPGAGKHGGQIVASGKLEKVMDQDTVTTKWIKTPFPNARRPRRQPERFVTIEKAAENNLNIDRLDIPLCTLTGICGVSGSGKSTLIIDTIARSQIKKKQTTSVSYELLPTGKFKSLSGIPEKVVLVDQSKADITTIDRYTGIDKIFSEIYQKDDASIALGYGKNVYKKTCTECGGRCVQRVDMEFMAASHVPCEACAGTGYGPEAWEVKIKGYSYPELLQLSVEELYQLWSDNDKIKDILGSVIEVGLGYLSIGQPAHSFSSGEAQRLKLAMALYRKEVSGTLYILDEPTSGLHNEDVRRLIDLLHRFVDNGASVWVVEHHLHMLVSCDYLIELGPGGGPHGGRVVAQGSPEQIASLDTATGKELREILK